MLRPSAVAPLLVLVSVATTACGDDSPEGTGGAGGVASTGGAEPGTTAGPGTGGNEGTGGSGGDGTVTTECGTFAPSEPGEGVVPDDPAADAIVASCAAFCDAFGSVCENGGFFRDVCIDDCRLRACDVCPGTIEPLTDCATRDTDVATCGCQDGVPVCATPASCGDLEDATTQCGG